MEQVKELAPNDAWEKHPQLKEAYEALEDKEGIVAQGEPAEEGADPPGRGGRLHVGETTHLGCFPVLGVCSPVCSSVCTCSYV